MKDTIHFHFKEKNENEEIISSKTERIGEHPEWYLKIKKLSDNNLNLQEQLIFYFSTLS